MSLLDINELPQPIYPETTTPSAEVPQATATPAAPATPAPNQTAPAAPSMAAPAAPATTTPTTTPTPATQVDVAALMQSTKVRIAAGVVALIALLGAAGSLAGGESGGPNRSSEFSNQSTSSTSSSSSASGSDDGDLAGTLDDVLFGFTNPTSSEFNCMASSLTSAGVDSSDLYNGSFDDRDLADAITGCVNSSTLLQEAGGFLTALYGPGYAADCLVFDFFGGFSSGDWNDWYSQTMRLDGDGIHTTLVNFAPYCFG